MELDLSNVVNVSASEAGAGIGEPNTSNLALFTSETSESSFGTDGYKIYRSPSGVGIDFGTGSKTYQMAVAVFSQKPNILANGGYLVVVKVILGKANEITFDGLATGGQWTVSDGNGNTSSALAFNVNSTNLQAAIRQFAGFELVTVTGSYSAGYIVKLNGAPETLTVQRTTLTDGTNPVNPSTAIINDPDGGSIADSVSASASKVHFAGVMASKLLTAQEAADFSTAVLASGKIGFVVSREAVDVEVGGKLDLFRSGSKKPCRGLYYGGTELEALIMQAAYAGRAMSTVFSGSRTTSTMHLKDLVGVQPDQSMTENLLAKCQAAGVDVYVSIQGVPKTFSSGKNGFWDSVYNLQWFVNALKVAIFNLLAQTSTKIAQTEDDMTKYRGAIRKVCGQAVTNGYAAPGVWTLPETFGVQEDFFANIEQLGFYVYTQPISQQPTADREARKAPIAQVALKEAGAVHSGNILVNVNK